ncbi:hypothetical protein CVIC8964_0808 [Campylobacter vicugnae]|uniref:Uncharacterized protein n=1 Tax=Campylobacter vicugnae TaxID=1660076 RepID=A0A1X9T135_9BACT|nr:hypothetical protein [Campylobacter sp. RM8964]ARR02220.1 hypothetical protein CVIC8964_0808 [Campylobacter sp. RM8964]
MGLKCVTMLIKDGNLSKDEIKEIALSKLEKYNSIDKPNDNIAMVINPISKDSFYLISNELKEALNLDYNIVEVAGARSDNSELNAKIAELDAKIDNEIVTLSNEILTKASLENHNNLVASLATYALKSDLDTLATKDELLTKANLSDLNTLATKDELLAKADLSNLDNLATKDELGLKANISSLDGLATKDELNNYALKSEINTSGGIDENTLNQAINQNATIQELGAKVNHMATNLQGATYTQLVATMKYLGYELPSELRAYADYNLFADDKLSGDLIIGFKPIEYTGSYGQAWENVAIYNELGEKLTAKYASISSDGLNIDAVFAKDIAHPKGDSFEAVPSDYVLADGEVRVSITLGAVSYYGATYGLRMLNNNPSSWPESFLGGSHSYDEWIFTFHNYKPTKFSITNGTATYGGYGYMTRYEMRLSIGNWSKTLTYENSNYPNNIEIDFTNLNFGSDAKTIELAKAWNVPVTPYDINSDMVGG